MKTPNLVRNIIRDITTIYGPEQISSNGIISLKANQIR